MSTERNLSRVKSDNLVKHVEPQRPQQIREFKEVKKTETIPTPEPESCPTVPTQPNQLVVSRDNSIQKQPEFESDGGLPQSHAPTPQMPEPETENTQLIAPPTMKSRRTKTDRKRSKHNSSVSETLNFNFDVDSQGSGAPAN